MHATAKGDLDRLLTLSRRTPSCWWPIYDRFASSAASNKHDTYTDCMPAPRPPHIQARREALAGAARARRQSLGLTQAQVAKRVGCDRQTINRLENCEVSPSLDRWFALAEALEVALTDLISAGERLPIAPEIQGVRTQVSQAARKGST